MGCCVLLPLLPKKSNMTTAFWLYFIFILLMIGNRYGKHYTNTGCNKKSVKKEAGYSCLSVGSKVTSKYMLTKGKVYTLSSKGKKKCIVKKKAKKLILKNKFAVKVKVGKKFINIANK